MRLKLVGFAILSLLVFSTQAATNWTIIDNIVREGIFKRVFPGAVVAIANSTHVMFQKPYGSLTYGP